MGTLSVEKQEKLEADAVKAEKKAEKKAEQEAKKKEVSMPLSCTPRPSYQPSSAQGSHTDKI